MNRKAVITLSAFTLIAAGIIVIVLLVQRENNNGYELTTAESVNDHINHYEDCTLLAVNPSLNLPQGELLYTEHVRVYAADNIITFYSNSVEIRFNHDTGLADFSRPGSHVPVLRGAAAEAYLEGHIVTSLDLSRDSYFFTWEDINDVFGGGTKISLVSFNDYVTFAQNFYFYNSQDFILMSLDLLGAEGAIVRTNYIAPIAADGRHLMADGDEIPEEVFDLGGGIEVQDPRFLFVPFDNDFFVRFASVPLLGADESINVTAIFDNYSRNGLIVGSVTHDTWKSGIRINHGRFNRLTDFRVFGGMTSHQTRDAMTDGQIHPHGFVSGEIVSSPLVFFGFYEDWRDGMEAFGSAVGTITPPLPWDEGPPFGWNSWGGLGPYVNFQGIVDTTNFFRDYLVPAGFANSDNDVVYINLDSFWRDNMTTAQLREFVRIVNANGHRAGIYFGPFSYWNVYNVAATVPGSGGMFSYNDILLRDYQGRFMPPFSGGGSGALSVDPTHPGARMKMEHYLDFFIDLGFEFVKMDFNSHGAREGVFYNPNITTGIQAYNYGMQMMINHLGDRITNQEFFISMAISPIFPGGQFAHARRVSCDVFGTIDSSEYLINSMTYGWWLNGTVYTFNDPDHIVIFNSFNNRVPISFNEGLTRYISAAIAGTLMLSGDDFSQRPARERALEMMTNPEVNRIASDGIAFRPIEGNTGSAAADAFMRKDSCGTLYLAVFNFSGTEWKNMRIELDRLGLSPGQVYELNCLLTNESRIIDGNDIRIILQPAQPGLMRITG